MQERKPELTPEDERLAVILPPLMLIAGAVLGVLAEQAVWKKATQRVADEVCAAEGSERCEAIRELVDEIRKEKEVIEGERIIYIR